MTNNAPVVNELFAALNERMDALQCNANGKVAYMEGYLPGILTEILRVHPEVAKFLEVHIICLKEYAENSRNIGR